MGQHRDAIPHGGEVVVDRPLPSRSPRDRMVAAWKELSEIDPATVDGVVYLEFAEAMAALERAIRKSREDGTDG